jgi:hypothetical protein
MAIPGSGEIAVTDLSTEFGGTAPHGLSEYYRGGGLVPDSATNVSIPTSGAIALGNFYGSANIVALNVTISSNTNNYDLYSTVSANPSYVAGATAVTLTVNPGVTVGSTSTGTYALSIPSGFNPADTVAMVNNGTVVGRGGNGGAGISYNQSGSNVGQAAGHGLYINRPVSITNAGTLAGGGGGGGSSRSARNHQGFWPKSGGPQGQFYNGSSGGGGGAGTSVGTGGAVGAPTGFAGANGTATSGGTGGARAPHPTGGYAGKGGNGGARGSAGSAAEVTTGTDPGPGGTPGATGRYITGNTYATWVANGTRLGGAS